MSAPFREYDPDQAFLFPPSLRDWLPDDHVAYFLLDVVSELNLKDIYAYYDFEEVKDEQGKVVGRRAKTNRGRPAYDPRMMTALLLYGYATGSVSSRQIEKKCQEDVAFRVLSANQKPDHDTIAEFRRVHLEALSGLFIQGLQLCREAGLVKLGHVALDGTKVKANASKHKAMSYDHMVKREEELKREIDELMKPAEEADQAEDGRYGKGKRGDELPEELSADAGYFSEENVKALGDRGIEALVAAERLKHGEKPPASRGPLPKGATPKERMMRKLQTLAGRAADALRKVTVEPVFGQIRTRGLVRFWMRGVEKVKAEWALWCLTHNLLKLFRSGWAPPLPS